MALQTDTQAPDFTLIDSDEKEVSLHQFRDKWVILYFYPKDNTSGCTREAIDFSEMLSSFNQKNAVIIGISPNTAKSHRSFIAKHNLKIILLCDPNHDVLEQYGVWQKKQMYGKEYMGVVRTTFCIDPKGNIREIWNKVKVDKHVSAVYESLCTFQ